MTRVIILLICGNNNNDQMVWRLRVYKLRNLLGLQVIEVNTGKVLGEVIKVFVNFDKAAIIGIEICSKHSGLGSVRVAMEDVYAIGNDAVMIRDFSTITTDHPSFKNNLISLDELLEKKVVSESGVQLGIIVDIYFDAVTGEIKDYELSESLITDLLYGRLAVPLPPAQVIGDDNIIVPESMLNLLRSVNS